MLTNKAPRESYIAPAHVQHRARVHLLGLGNGLSIILHLPAPHLQPHGITTPHHPAIALHFKQAHHKTTIGHILNDRGLNLSALFKMFQ